MDIELLLTCARERGPLLEDGLALESAGMAPRPQQLLPRNLRNDTRDLDSLPLQRWAVIAPEGPAGDRLLGCIDRLCRAREEAQGTPALVYRVPAGMSVHQAVEWKDTVYWAEGVPEEELPRYVLILGDLDQVSLALQQVLASDLFVGRLALGHALDYEAYVDKVLAWERDRALASQSRALFCTVRDGTSATAIGDSALMQPTIAACRARKDGGLLPLGDIVELGRNGPSLGELVDAAARRGPSLLFTISHGLGAPRNGWRSVAEQHALQGAMSVGRDGCLTAEDVASRPFLPGGIWFYMACYGGATPSASAYHAWLRKLQEVDVFPRRPEAVLASLPGPGEKPFTAALPRAVLASPEGPLAVVAHADLAWTYSFQSLRMRESRPMVRDRPSRFQALFRSILDGSRVGVAFHELLRYFGEVNSELTAIYQAEESGDVAGDERTRVIDKACLFMLRNDLAGYILLGDPAVRLPFTPPVTGPSRRPVEDLASRAASVLGMAGVQPGLPEPAVMEDAVLALLGGVDGEPAIAARAGVTRAELLRWLAVYKAAGRAALEKLGR